MVKYKQKCMCALSDGARDLTKREKTKRGENHCTRTSRCGPPATTARLNHFILFKLGTFYALFICILIFLRFSSVFIPGQCSFSSTVLLHAVPGSPADVATHEDGIKVTTFLRY